VVTGFLFGISAGTLFDKIHNVDVKKFEFGLELSLYRQSLFYFILFFNLALVIQKLHTSPLIFPGCYFFANQKAR